MPKMYIIQRQHPVGKRVSSLKVADKVFGFDDQGSGSHAQFMTIIEDKVVTIPENMSYEQVAASSEGANKVIDYTKEDFTKDDQKYNFVFDAVGKSSFFKCKQLLQPGGVYISSDLGYMAQNIFLPLITPMIKPMIGHKKTVSPIPTDMRGSLLLVKNLMEQGKFKAVIDGKFPLEQIVEAYKYVEKGQKIGNVVIAVKHNDKS